MAISAYLSHRPLLTEIEALNVAFMVKTNKIGKVVNFFPRNGLLFLPILEKLLYPGPIFHPFNQIVATHALIQPRNTRYIAAARAGMAIHAIYLHQPCMGIVRKLNGLRDHGSQRAVAIGCLAADGSALLKGVLRLNGAVAVALLDGLGDRKACQSKRKYQ